MFSVCPPVPTAAFLRPVQNLHAVKLWVGILGTLGDTDRSSSPDSCTKSGENIL